MTIAEVLETQYRKLYWEHNELQLIGTPACISHASILEIEMCHIEATLGYVPEA